jgi:hypothetical protein
MIREAGAVLPAAALISLDHDLESELGGADPGDGYMVAQWLVSQPIVRPVIVHSSNGERSAWMAGAFDLAGWQHYRVAPLGDDWVESDWPCGAPRTQRRPPKPTPQGTVGDRVGRSTLWHGLCIDDGVTFTPRPVARTQPCCPLPRTACRRTRPSA